MPFVDDDAAGRGAALSGRAEAAPQAAVDRQLEVGVVEDDDRVLAAHLEVDLLERRRGGLVHEPAGRRRSGERDDPDGGMGDERRPGAGAIAGHEVDDAGRQAGVGQRLHEVDGRERRLLGRLQHHGVAADQGREDLPGRHGDREVPGGDQAAHARPAGGSTSRTCCAARTVSSGRRGGGPRPPSAGPCRWLPARRRPFRRRPCPSRGSCRAQSGPCARRTAAPPAAGCRPASGPAPGATSCRPPPRTPRRDRRRPSPTRQSVRPGRSCPPGCGSRRSRPRRPASTRH